MKNGRDALKMTEIDLKKTKEIWWMKKLNISAYFELRKKLYKLQWLEINTSNLKNRNKFYKLMKSQLALQCPKAKMYLPTKAYSELDYHKWPKWTQITKKMS